MDPKVNTVASFCSNSVRIDIETLYCSEFSALIIVGDFLKGETALPGAY